MEILLGVPLDPKDRNVENTQELKRFLRDNNMFMAKIHEEIVSCLLVVNRLIWVQKEELIYKSGA